MAYDGQGRPLQTENTDGKARSYSYNESGMVTEIIDFDGSRIIGGYNALNKLETFTDQEGRTARFEYDAVGRLTWVADPKEPKPVMNMMRMED